MISTAVDGRLNKIGVKYKNASETIWREADRNVKEVVFIQGTEELDFNTIEHYLAANVQKQYL